MAAATASLPTVPLHHTHSHSPTHIQCLPAPIPRRPRAVRLPPYIAQCRTPVDVVVRPRPPRPWERQSPAKAWDRPKREGWEELVDVPEQRRLSPSSTKAVYDAPLQLQAGDSEDIGVVEERRRDPARRRRAQRTTRNGPERAASWPIRAKLGPAPEGRTDDDEGQTGGREGTEGKLARADSVATKGKDKVNQGTGAISANRERRGSEGNVGLENDGIVRRSWMAVKRIRLRRCEEA